VFAVTWSAAAGGGMVRQGCESLMIAAGEMLVSREYEGLPEAEKIRKISEAFEKALLGPGRDFLGIEELLAVRASGRVFDFSDTRGSGAISFRQGMEQLAQVAARIQDQGALGEALDQVLARVLLVHTEHRRIIQRRLRRTPGALPDLSPILVPNMKDWDSTKMIVSDDGKQILSVKRAIDKVRPQLEQELVWVDARTGQITRSLPFRVESQGENETLALSPDFTEVLYNTGHHSALQIFDLRSWQERRPGIYVRDRQFGSEVDRVAFSPSGDRALLVHFSASRLFLWSPGNLDPPIELQDTLRNPTDQRFHPNGEEFVTFHSNGEVRVRSAQDGAVLRTLWVDENCGGTVRFLEDGKHLLTAAITPSLTSRFRMPKHIPVNHYIISIWNYSDGTLLKSDHFERLATNPYVITPQGKWLIELNRNRKILSFTLLKNGENWRIKLPDELSGEYQALRISSNGRYLGVRTVQGVLVLYDLAQLPE
jgi:hypothetical protein